MDINKDKTRREHMRWVLMLTLNNARPLGCHDSTALITVQGIYEDATQLEVRRELDYLASRKLVEIERTPDGYWFAKLTRFGVDIVEYTAHCEPGIARPKKYW